jgi:hypothetical protein
MTLILTFSLREKEIIFQSTVIMATTRWKTEFVPPMTLITAFSLRKKKLIFQPTVVMVTTLWKAKFLSPRERAG